MIIFDGKQEAKQRKRVLLQKIKKYTHIHIYALIFQEDKPSIIYTRLKKKDAEEVGIEYESVVVSLHDSVDELCSRLTTVASRDDVDGMIIQKPQKKLLPSTDWWSKLVSCIPVEKDIDGLRKDSFVLPATAQAITDILHIALLKTGQELHEVRIAIIGKSDIVGAPVYTALLPCAKEVRMFGRSDCWEDVLVYIQNADVVISATGEQDILHACDLKRGCIVIDAASPHPEVNPEGLQDVVSFLSPVPGGVGPMTRVCLLENTLTLKERKSRLEFSQDLI